MNDPIKNKFDYYTVSYLTGEISKEEQAHFFEILDAREDLKEEFESYQRLSNVLDEISKEDIDAMIGSEESPSLQPSEQKIRRYISRLDRKYRKIARAPFYARPGFAAAASLFVVLLVAAFLMTLFPETRIWLRGDQQSRYSFHASKTCRIAGLQSARQKMALQSQAIPWNALLTGSNPEEACRIEFADIIAVIDTDSAIRFRQRPNGLLLSHIKGSLYLKAEKMTPGFDFAIYTGSGVVRLLGTEIVLHKKPGGQSLLEVQSGAAEYNTDLITMSEGGAALSEDLILQMQKDNKTGMQVRSRVVSAGSALVIPSIPEDLKRISREIIQNARGISPSDQAPMDSQLDPAKNEAIRKRLSRSIEQTVGAAREIDHLPEAPYLRENIRLPVSRQKELAGFFQSVSEDDRDNRGRQNEQKSLFMPGPADYTIDELSPGSRSKDKNTPGDLSGDRSNNESVKARSSSPVTQGSNGFKQRIILYDGTVYEGNVWEENEIYHIKVDGKIHRFPASQVHLVEMIGSE